LIEPVAVFIDISARRRGRDKQAVIRLSLLPVYRSDVIRSLRLFVVVRPKRLDVVFRSLRLDVVAEESEKNGPDALQQRFLA